jgi:hypothetical protein
MQSRGAMSRAVWEITMNDKKKKQAVRVLMAKRGSKHESAHRILVPGGASGDPSLRPPLEDRLERLIPLAEAALNPTASLASMTAVDSTPAARDPEAALVQALRTFSVQDLYRSETVMYAGRDLGDAAVRRRYFSLHETLLRDDRDITIAMMTEKSPLASYLTRGLKLAKQLGLRLEDLSDVREPRPPRVAAEQFGAPMVERIPEPPQGAPQ